MVCEVESCSSYIDENISIYWWGVVPTRSTTTSTARHDGGKTGNVFSVDFPRAHQIRPTNPALSIITRAWYGMGVVHTCIYKSACDWWDDTTKNKISSRTHIEGSCLVLHIYMRVVGGGAYYTLCIFILSRSVGCLLMNGKMLNRAKAARRVSGLFFFCGNAKKKKSNTLPQSVCLGSVEYLQSVCVWCCVWVFARLAGLSISGCTLFICVMCIMWVGRKVGGVVADDVGRANRF